MAARRNWLMRTRDSLISSAKALGFGSILGYGIGTSISIASSTGGMSQPIYREYSDIQSMSALGAFPWVRACVLAVAEDLAARRIIVEEETADGWVELDDHPILDLLGQPQGDEPGTMGANLWMRQRVVDWVLAGNSYHWWQSVGTMSYLWRLHPEYVKPMADGWRITGYQINGVGKVYPPEEILHTRQVSWTQTLDGLLGEGAIRALHQDLTADLAATQQTARAAQRGQHDYVIRPADKDKTWNRETVEAISIKAEEQAQAGRTALVLGGQADVTQLSYSPRDMEFASQREYTRETILAVFNCPPSRVGLPTANYATQQQQMQTYWQCRVADAALLDAEDTHLARRMTPGRRIRVRRDFSDVPELQESRTERQGRVLNWQWLGLSAAEAARIEGFEDVAAILEEREAAAAQAGVSQDKQRTALNGAQVASLRLILADVSAGILNPEGAVAFILAAFGDISPEQAEAIVAGVQPTEAEPDAPAADAPPPADDEERAAPATEAARRRTWDTWVRQVHTPVERRMAIRMRRFLAQQADRIVMKVGAWLEGERRATVGAAYVVRQFLTDDDIDLIMTGEDDALRAAILPEILRGIEVAFDDAADQLDAVGELPLDAGPIVQPMVAQFVEDVGETTAEIVRQIVELGLAEGASTADIQSRLQQAAAFTPTRALRIARTETTRATNAGTQAAYESYERVTGDTIRKQWLSSRDAHVRGSHRSVDGQTVGVNEDFTLISGDHSGSTAPAPGLFGIAGEDINCRCTTIPVL